jgi:ribosome maturation protein SDO1
MPFDIKRETREDLTKERVIARLEREGETFEILVEPSAVEPIRKGEDVDMAEHMAIDRIFRDVKKGERASEEKMEKVFGTRDPVEVGRVIVQKGEIQLTTEQRRAMQEAKRKKIVSIIAANAINPQTRTPHPPQRLELAMDEAKVHVDPFKPAEDQVDAVLDALRPILPIRFETATVAIKLSGEDYGRCYADIVAFGKITREEWQKDGSWIGVVELPAGLQTELYDRLNERTHGTVETKAMEKKG